MRLGWLIAIVLSFQSIAFSYPLTPDHNKTPGQVCDSNDKDFVEYRYGEKIPYCYRNVSSWTKAQIFRAYRIPEACWNRYTIDHLIPLSIGGNNEVTNLWPEHKYVKALRPNLELELYRELAQGLITQKEAIAVILEKKFYPKNPGKNNGDGCDVQSR